MDYFKIYNRLIDRSKTRELLGYTEKHHVVPKCMGGTDTEDNLVVLTPEEHYLAHQLLARMYPTNTGLVSAAMYMCSRSNNKVYGWLRRRWSAHMKINNPNKNGVARLKYIEQHGHAPAKNYVLSEEGKRILQSKMLKENPMSGIKPWNHPKQTQKTKQMWFAADVYFDSWIANDKPAYSKLAKIHNESWCRTHVNMVRMFRDGWNPRDDLDWIKCKI